LNTKISPQNQENKANEKEDHEKVKFFYRKIKREESCESGKMTQPVTTAIERQKSLKFYKIY
jgi:hypothetical protein